MIILNSLLYIRYDTKQKKKVNKSFLFTIITINYPTNYIIYRNN